MWQATRSLAGRSHLCFGLCRTAHFGHYFLNYFSKEKSSSTLNLPYMELLRTSEQVGRCYTFSDFSGGCVFRSERTTTKCVYLMMVTVSLAEPCACFFICLFIIDFETSTGETESLLLFFICLISGLAEALRMSSNEMQVYPPDTQNVKSHSWLEH